VKLLLDTHLLLRAAGEPKRLSNETRGLLAAAENQLLFSVASIWEIVIKRALGRQDFRVDAARLRRKLRENGYTELPILGAHVIAVESLPPIHRDPIDRILIAQAAREALTLLTSDAAVARYPGEIKLV
jgi:PIN domain nuclease of toxin-antitoxin system